MARNLEHLELPIWQQSLARRKPKPPPTPTRDWQAHGSKLETQAEQLARNFVERIKIAPRGINPKLVFKLRTQGSLDESKLSSLGLHLLAKEGKNAIVVFPDEQTLNSLRNRLREYTRRDKKHSHLGSIEEILELTPQDRVGRKLREKPLESGEIAALDIELWHSGNNQECRQKIDEVTRLLRGQGLRVTDQWVGESLCLIRATVNQTTLNALVEIDYVKEIDRRSAPTFEMTDVFRLDLSQVDFEQPPQGNLVGVLVIDSGVAQRHPLIEQVLGDAQVFPDSLRQRIRGGPEDGDEKTHGHGTAVAGIAVYSDIGECIASRAFIPTAQLFSARVTDENNEYDPEELIEHQLEGAISHFLENYPSIKVINISLGDSRLVYKDGGYQFRLAATLDGIAYRYRDREIIFVISAGNFVPTELNSEEILNQYPRYLIEQDQSRIIDPATSALALTVGGLSYGAGKDLQQYHEKGTERLVAGKRGWPSPFTRTGWGVDGAIKPELVDFAGDLRFERGNIPDIRPGSFPQYAGLLTTSKNFAPPDGHLFRTVSGTSFAAPRVANLAARLFQEFPNASSNLIRALIVNSAQVPSDRPGIFSEEDSWDEATMRVYGYGQPNFERAKRSDQNDVLLITDRIIDVDTFQLFVIPSLPPEFLRTNGNRYLSVTLAFDPPTRHTRGDSYLGIGMGFNLFRNLSPEKVSEVCKKAENVKPPSLTDLASKERVALNPGPTIRETSTVQRGICQIKSSNWGYDDGPLVLAVTCKRKWAPLSIMSQRFAIVASVHHTYPFVDLYTHLRQQARIYQRVRLSI